MKQKLTCNLNMLDVIKLTIVFTILCFVFFDLKNLTVVLMNKPFKIIFLLIILFILYYDLHTGILLTVVFLMLIIQFNTTTLNELETKKLEFFLSSVPAEYTKDERTAKPITVECDNVKKNEISQDIFDYSVDTKVKPYEVFVKMLTTKDHLDNASNSAFLQPEPEELL